MNISKTNIDDLNAVLTIDVKPDDYTQKVEDAIKKVSKNVAVAGFRAGKVPNGLVRKMYGKSILAEELNKLLNDSLYSYLNENKIEILGHPLPQNNDVDFEQQKEYSFKYDLGLAPEFEVEISDKVEVNYETVKVDEALVNKYISDVRRNYGKPVNPDVAGEKDVVFVDINQLEADGSITPGGIFKSTSLGLDRIKSEKAKKGLIGVKKDDKIVFASKDLFEDALEMSIMLGIDKEVAENLDCQFQLTVKNIARLEDAELNQELFDRIYGAGTVTNEEEFKNKIKEELGVMFNRDSDQKFFAAVENKLLEMYKLKLPDAFLKRWIMAANDKPVTAEQIENEYEAYSKITQWRLIESKIYKKYNVIVSPEEAKNEALNYVRSQFARYGQNVEDSEAEKIAGQILAKEEEARKVYENIYQAKLLQLFKEKLKLNPVEVSHEEFFKRS